jgi:hypothetical protein
MRKGIDRNSALVRLLKLPTCLMALIPSLLLDIPTLLGNFFDQRL